MTTKDNNILKKAIKLITGHDASNIEVNKDDAYRAPEVIYQAGNRNWYVIKLHDMKELYKKQQDSRKEGLREFNEAYGDLKYD